MTQSAVLVERHGSVAVVTLNQPRRRNALSKMLCAELSRTLSELQDDPELRALVLHGGAQFCAGGDLSDLDDPPVAMRQAMLEGHRNVRMLTGGHLPVVAAVEGNAFGAGFSLAMACDFVVADEDSAFCAAFGRVGLQPDYGLLWSLPQRVGIGLAREIVMFCEPVKGTQAQQIGLIDRLAERGQVLAQAIAHAQRLAKLPPGTVATTKAILSRLPMSLDTMLAWEADTQSLLLGTADFAEGVKAFVEKRAAVFTGR